jgi:hypothetical protein
MMHLLFISILLAVVFAGSPEQRAENEKYGNPVHVNVTSPHKTTFDTEMFTKHIQYPADQEEFADVFIVRFFYFLILS